MTHYDLDELIELAWRDEVSFEDIAAQTGYREREVIAIMRRVLRPKSFRNWRKRVSGRKTKHKRQFNSALR